VSLIFFPEITCALWWCKDKEFWCGSHHNYNLVGTGNIGANYGLPLWMLQPGHLHNLSTFVTSWSPKHVEQYFTICQSGLCCANALDLYSADEPFEQLSIFIFVIFLSFSRKMTKHVLQLRQGRFLPNARLISQSTIWCYLDECRFFSIAQHCTTTAIKNFLEILNFSKNKVSSF
jgi:hypothetical protein